MARVTFCATDGWNAFNGINAWLVRFLPELAASGHELRVLLFPWSPPHLCTTLPLLRKAGLNVDVVYPPRYTESAIYECLRHARRHQTSVFVANAVTPALLAGRALRKYGVATAGILHNDDGEYRAKADLFWNQGSSGGLSALVAISTGLCTLASPAAPSKSVHIIPYGVPLNNRLATWNRPQPLRLIYHGRIVQIQKRILETVSAAQRLCHRHYGRLEIDFIGSGPQEGDIRRLIASDDAGGRVRFLGGARPDEIPSILPRYHGTLLLSDHEGLGLSVLEGMAAGLVPVCLRTESGIPDIVEDDVNGVLVRDRDASLDEAVARLLSDPAGWRRLSGAALRTVRVKFSTEACLRQWTALIEELASSATPIPGPMPRRTDLKLPPVHPALVHEDLRYPGWRRALWRRLRFPRQALR